MTNLFPDYKNTDVFLMIGANPAENHPQVMRFAGIAVATRGAKIIVVDPRYTKTASKAHIYAPIRPGTDIAFLYGLKLCHREQSLFPRIRSITPTRPTWINPDYSFNDGVFFRIDRKRR